MLLKKIIAKMRHFELPEVAKNILLIVSSLLIFDVLLAGLGGSYLSENIGTFLGKSRTVILSDLLFLEGVPIFAIGTFIAVAKAAQKIEPSSEQTTERTNNAEQTPARRINIGTLLIIVGAILIGLSIAVGTLLI